MKTNKSYTKRLKVTKTGKVIARKKGQNHYNAKESATEKNTKRRTDDISFTKRTARRFLPRTNVHQ